MRGSLSGSALIVSKKGIIPAGAGLTLSKVDSIITERDHPRGCGAHCAITTGSAKTSGSSPRVRGSRRQIDVRHELAGIIPAGAGLTASRNRRHLRTGDHPRGCGAHQLLPCWTIETKGSSPRVRGSRLSCRRGGADYGIIPAGAGLTSARPWPSRSDRDHPRGCGAHVFSAAQFP